MTHAQRFMEQFESTWGDPARFPGIYEPEAIIRTPVLRQPVVARELAEFVRRTKTLLPDARLCVQRWAADGDAVFLEWQITATLGGEPLEWKGMSRFTLNGALATEEAVYFDTLPLWERLDPGMRRPGLLDEPPAEPVESEAENLAVVNRYYDDVWNQGRLVVLDEVVSRDLVGHEASLGDFGFARLQDLVVEFRRGFPDFHVTAEDVVARGDRVALRFRSEGTFRGEFMGIAPTGIRIVTVGLVMYRLRARKIVEIWMGWDPDSLRRQVGMGLDAAAHAAP
jgi:predicted ester cyclase